MNKAGDAEFISDFQVRKFTLVVTPSVLPPEPGDEKWKSFVRAEVFGEDLAL